MPERDEKESILIIDDTPANIGVLVEMLTEAGYNVFVAEDGESGIEQAEFACPDIVLLDVMMPGIDGFETCTLMKSNQQTRDIPIVFMTALSDSMNIVKGLSAGAVDYVSKPFQHDEVLARLKTHLTIRRLQRESADHNEQLKAEIEVRKAAEEALREAHDHLASNNRELAYLNEKKNEFMGVAAHDLRNPLSGILNYAELIRINIKAGSYDEESAIEDLETVSRLARRMSKMINDLLDISAIESGKINLRLKEESLPEILRESVELYGRSAKQKSIELSQVLDEGIPPVLCDRDRVLEVLDNLLSNAIKFTHPGGRIKVSCTVRDGDVVTQIEDSGQGLSQEDLKHVFKSFKPLSAKPTAGEKSTGLGLAIVKKIVEVHGGRVWVESEQGKGSVFSFSLSSN